jgi:hypothetical protein
LLKATPGSVFLTAVASVVKLMLARGQFKGQKAGFASNMAAENVA